MNLVFEKFLIEERVYLLGRGWTQAEPDKFDAWIVPSGFPRAGTRFSQKVAVQMQRDVDELNCPIFGSHNDE